MVRNSCDLDLLVFLHRHPRSFLTSEQLATFLGYALNRVAESLDSFISAGLLERTQNPLHAARLYLLQVDGPRDEGLRTLLQLGTTRPGRRRILETLGGGDSSSGSASSQKKLRLLRIA